MRGLTRCASLSGELPPGAPASTPNYPVRALKDLGEQPTLALVLQFPPLARQWDEQVAVGRLILKAPLTGAEAYRRS